MDYQALLHKFQSTLPVKGATTLRLFGCWYQNISIHAPREGSDIISSLIKMPKTIISIHAPREGSDISVRNPNDQTIISIHAPREGSDFVFFIFSDSLCLFQSTLPVKGATAMLTNFSVTIVQLSANSTNFSL